jgi:uncharacterized membrane protein
MRVASLRGLVDLRFVIGLDGRVSQVTALSELPADVTSCLRKLIATLRFATTALVCSAADAKDGEPLRAAGPIFLGLGAVLIGKKVAATAVTGNEPSWSSVTDSFHITLTQFDAIMAGTIEGAMTDGTATYQLVGNFSGCPIFSE